MSAPSPHSAPRRKELGAFYTPPAMADLLVDWAVRERGDRVLDASFGGLVFLESAKRRLLQLGVSPATAIQSLFGADLDPGAHEAAAASELALLPSQLVCTDFFLLEPGRELPAVEAVVGNPPYIRYQGFNAQGDGAHQVAAAAGVRLTRLASSWAPFIVHAAAFVAAGGRMAQVLPAEILHAQYAAEVIDFLRRRFESVTLISFEERVFPGALEEVVLLLADNCGAAADGAPELRSCRSLDDARATLAPRARAAARSRPKGRGKLLAQLLPEDVQMLYARLDAAPEVARLGALASVDIGAVTGANDFFLLRRGEEPQIPSSLIRTAVSKAEQIAGARLARRDIERLARAGARYRLFRARGELPRSVHERIRPYLERGEALDIPARYKCRVRDPWWAVPIPGRGVPELLLTYCANRFPRMVVNEVRALHTNTIHAVRLQDENATPAGLAASFYNSLTLLSAELVGRSYGGGVLKLEPSEAEALLIPPPIAGARLGEVDELVLRGELDAVLDLVDPIVLGDGLGLAPQEIVSLRAAGAQLRERRRARGKRPRAH